MCKNNIKINELETQILDALLKGDDPVLNTLRVQFDNLKIIKREFSGCGFFTHFSVPESCQKVDPASFVIDDVHLEVEDTENGASAMLFVRDGIIDFLEIIACTGNWPDNPILKSLNYFTKKRKSASVLEQIPLLKSVIYLIKRRRKGPILELIPSEKRDIEVTKLAWEKRLSKN